MNFVINPARFCFWDSTAGRPLAATERPVVVYGSPFNLAFTLSDSSVNANAIYSLAIDDDFDFSNDNVMAYSVADSVANGVVSFQDVNTKTTKFHDLILGKQFSRVYIQITETIGTATRVLCVDWMIAGGVVLDGEGDPETLQPVLEQARVYSANAILAASDARAWAEENAAAVEVLGGTFSAKGWAEEAEQAAAAAATAVDRAPEICTEFSVYANATAIPVGSTHSVLGFIQESPFDGGASLPAQMTCKFALRSETPNAESDVTISWGDGTVTRISADTLDWTQTDADGEVVNVVAHTYLTEGKYKVKVYGRDYFGICHWLGVASQNSNYANDALDYNKECNLLCDLDGLKIAPNLTNLASFARCSQRLTSVHVDQASSFFYSAVNTASMLLSCWNLASFDGVGDRKTAIRACSEMFRDCHNMTACDFMIPSSSNRTNYCAMTFYNCQKLATSISSLLPKSGFSAKKMDFAGVFYCCAALTGTIPAWMLWESPIEWGNTSYAFDGSAFKHDAPVAWGGYLVFPTASDVRDGIVLDLPLETDLLEHTGAGTVTAVYDGANPLAFAQMDGSPCAHFDGNAALVLPATDGGRFDFNDKPFAVCFWIAKPSSNAWESVVNKRISGGSADYYFGFNYDRLCFYNRDSAKVSNNDLLKNLWHHVALVVSASSQNIAVYVDGVQIGSFGNSYCDSSNKNYLMIGGCCYLSDPTAATLADLVETLHGYMHHLRIYNRTITAAEVKTVMKATRTNKVDDVVVLNPNTSSHTLFPSSESYSLDLSQKSSVYLLQCADTAGVEYVWSLDIKLSANASIQYGSMFDATNSDSLTPSKLNRCVVRWDGSKAILCCYRVEDIA